MVTAMKGASAVTLALFTDCDNWIITTCVVCHSSQCVRIPPKIVRLHCGDSSLNFRPPPAEQNVLGSIRAAEA